MKLDLTVAIPAHNDEEALVRLLTRLAVLEVARQVIIVDDASQSRLDSKRLSAKTGLAPACLSVLHHSHNKGAGAARNLALLLVKTSHILFLDADDLPTSELRGLCKDLAGREFDFSIFQHHDSRMNQDRLWGQMHFDQEFWDMSGVGMGALSNVTFDAMTKLVQTANYPWNKIYRTAFLRDHGIACSETFVHNDIELHWRSFLNARRVLASDRVGVVHFVDHSAARLTNRRGPERFAVFPILEKIAREIAQGPTPGWNLPFFAFSTGLLDWICSTLQPELRATFIQRAQAFLQTYLPVNLREEIARMKPEAYARIAGEPLTEAP